MLGVWYPPPTVRSGGWCLMLECTAYSALLWAAWQKLSLFSVRGSVQEIHSALQGADPAKQNPWNYSFNQFVWLVVWNQNHKRITLFRLFQFSVFKAIVSFALSTKFLFKIRPMFIETLCFCFACICIWSLWSSSLCVSAQHSTAANHFTSAAVVSVVLKQFCSEGSL